MTDSDGNPIFQKVPKDIHIWKMDNTQYNELIGILKRIASALEKTMEKMK
jgi:hypothetical protein